MKALGVLIAVTVRTERRIVAHTSLLSLHRSLALQTAGSTVGTPHRLQLGQPRLQVLLLLLLEQHTAVRKFELFLQGSLER